MNRAILRRLVLSAMAICLAFALPMQALAADQPNTYYLGKSVNAGKDTGFSEANQINKDDPHFGWELGSFVITGYTSIIDGETPIFLKNAGDDVRLSFRLDQDIDALNGDSSKVISEDTKGYDEYFAIPERNFGRGMLIVKHTNYQNVSSGPVMYEDYLTGLVVGSDTEIGLYDEGDYEVAVDYEIKTPGLLGNPIFPTYNNYRIYFKFKVRNSNTMAFLFDSETHNELFNGSLTPNGFKLDLAGSHYLNVSIKKEVLNDTGNGLQEDTRFNKSAKDGDVFTDPGIYTVTIRNPNTEEEPTTKRIYVGDDQMMMLVVANSMTIEEAKAALQQGATVAPDGTLTAANVPIASGTSINPENEFKGFPVLPLIIVVVLVVVALLIIVGRSRKKQLPEGPVEIEAVIIQDSPSNDGVKSFEDGDEK